MNWHEIMDERALEMDAVIARELRRPGSGKAGRFQRTTFARINRVSGNSDNGR